jgi:hypothetical protein
MFLNLEKKFQEIKTARFRNLRTKLKTTPWDLFLINEIQVFLRKNWPSLVLIIVFQILISKRSFNLDSNFFSYIY